MEYRRLYKSIWRFYKIVGLIITFRIRPNHRVSIVTWVYKTDLPEIKKVAEYSAEEEELDEAVHSHSRREEIQFKSKHKKKERKEKIIVLRVLHVCQSIRCCSPVPWSFPTIGSMINNASRDRRFHRSCGRWDPWIAREREEDPAVGRGDPEFPTAAD